MDDTTNHEANYSAIIPGIKLLLGAQIGKTFENGKNKLISYSVTPFRRCVRQNRPLERFPGPAQHRTMQCLTDRSQPPKKLMLRPIRFSVEVHATLSFRKSTILAASNRENVTRCAMLTEC